MRTGAKDGGACARVGHDRRGVEFCLNDWIMFDNAETIDNPRFVRKEPPHMADLQRQQETKKRGSFRYSGWART